MNIETVEGALIEIANETTAIRKHLQGTGDPVRPYRPRLYPVWPERCMVCVATKERWPRKTMSDWDEIGLKGPTCVEHWHLDRVRDIARNYLHKQTPRNKEILQRKPFKEMVEQIADRLPAGYGDHQVLAIQVERHLQRYLEDLQREVSD